MSMKIAAVTAEYNPFHSGHAYHLAATREQLGATHIVAIMSGNFVQRGDCAIAPKQVRARMALLGGADLVLELPLPWAMAGAEKFALGAVSLADSLGGVDILSFGSECGDIGKICDTAALLCSDALSDALREGLAKGESFASVRQQAAALLLPGADEILASPNDTLGAEYCKALLTLGSKIAPQCIKRTGAAHDSEQEDEHVSASLLRRRLSLGEPPSHIPEQCLPPLQECLAAGHAPASLERLDRAILCRLRQMTAAELAALPDISEGLQNRIYKCIRTAPSYTALCDDIKVKRYTHARIRRILLSALLGLTAQDAAGAPPYIRILGMNKRGREIMNAASPTLPVITRYADTAQLGERGRRIFKLECRAGDIFALSLPTPVPCGMDMTEKLIVL